MNKIVFYDLILLGIFLLLAIIFFTLKRHNLKRQGLLYLYRTKKGIKLIDKFTKKNQKILRPMQYLVVASGYILMFAAFWLIIKTTYLYLSTSIAEIFRAPPIAPLIPYFPKIFGVESFFPPFYFSYFIIAFAIVALSHEFAHGIFARLNKFKIHYVGLAFLGPFLGAFVEPDEKQMAKAKKFPQLAVLAAGTFANLLMFLIFVLILMLFFWASFFPIGVKFADYAFTAVPFSEVKVVGDSDIVKGIKEIEVKGKKYFAFELSIKQAQQKNLKEILVYEDSPAFRAQIKGAILEIDGEPIKSYDELRNVISKYSPGDEITIKTAELLPGQEVIKEIKTQKIKFSEKNGKAFLGIMVFPKQRDGFISYIYSNTVGKIKDPTILYESKNNNLGWFIYYLIWWIVTINILVALFNMLPLGILDGGKFFLLSAALVTKNEKAAKVAYRFMHLFLLGLLLIMMFRWVLTFIN